MKKIIVERCLECPWNQETGSDHLDSYCREANKEFTAPMKGFPEFCILDEVEA